MPYLVDSDVLIHLIARDSPQHATARSAVRVLRERRENLYFTLQNAAEFWNGCTRPATSRNGLGMSVLDADRALLVIERLFTILPDPMNTYAVWRKLVASGVSGKQVHDARLASVILAHGLSDILTFNVTDFTRYSGITPVHPQDIK